MPPNTRTARASEPKVETTNVPQPQPVPRTKPFTIKLNSSIPA
jgi:hypothetical protein